ncbi:MAG: hypothetical protein JW808_10495 [Victivallales bacterium]|nr:hypothetical protein [Victivallales bacterium]
MKPSLLVLAAGIGSRYGGLKQIDPVGPSGEIIIDYSIHDAIRAGFKKVVFIIRKNIEKDFKECIGSRFEQKLDTHYVFQELDSLPKGYNVPENRQKPWGTGHAILAAKDSINEPFAVINADDFYGRHGYKMLFSRLAGVANSATEYFMVGFKLGNTLSEHGHVARGVCKVAQDGTLKEVVERTKIEKTPSGAVFTDETGQTHHLSPDETVSMNMWGFTPSIFTPLEEQFKTFLDNNLDNPKAEFFIPSVVGNLIDSALATVKVLQSKDHWFGVTYREDKPVVEKQIESLVAKGFYPKNVLN